MKLSQHMYVSMSKLHPIVLMQLQDMINIAESLGAEPISTTHFSAVFKAKPTPEMDAMQQLMVMHDLQATILAANYVSTLLPSNIIDTHYVSVQYKLPFA